MFKNTEYLNEFNAVYKTIQNATNKLNMQSVIYFLSCCILTWIECLIISSVFVAVGMYNLILTGSICLVDRYEKTMFCKKYIMDK